MAIVALFAGKFLDWIWLDPLMGLVGAIVIFKWSYDLVRDTGVILGRGLLYQFFKVMLHLLPRQYNPILLKMLLFYLQDY